MPGSHFRFEILKISIVLSFAFIVSCSTKPTERRTTTIPKVGCQPTGSGSSSFFDDFGDSSINPSCWTQIDGSVFGVVSNNQLNITPVNTMSYIGIESVPSFDLTGKSIVIEIPQLLADSSHGETDVFV